MCLTSTPLFALSILLSKSWDCWHCPLLPPALAPHLFSSTDLAGRDIEGEQNRIPCISPPRITLPIQRPLDAPVYSASAPPLAEFPPSLKRSNGPHRGATALFSPQFRRLRELLESLVQMGVTLQDSWRRCRLSTPLPAAGAFALLDHL